MMKPNLLLIPAPIKVLGQVFEKMPEDLYIPPDALRVFLETFEGPLDLLLYLIKKQNLNILDIPIMEITKQYIQYIELMQALEIELVAEYLLMATLLAEIKSRLLLPKPKKEEEAEEDPRAALMQQLQEYERYKKAAVQLDTLPQVGRDFYIARAFVPTVAATPRARPIDLLELLQAYQDALAQAALFKEHEVHREVLSVRERMALILGRLPPEIPVPFYTFYTRKEGRMGVVVSLMAILELLRQGLIWVEQTTAFATIYVGPPSTMDDVEIIAQVEVNGNG